MPEKLSIAIDVGGTFTDVVGATTRGRLLLVKVPTTPADPAQGVVSGLRRILAMAGLANQAVERFIHGTTVATNAVVERKGARTGLLTTEGFEDVLAVGRQKRSELYNLFIEPETPVFLAPRRRRYGVRERVDSSGNVLVPLDEASVRAAVRELRDVHRVGAVSVCYLFSFLNPAHEQRTREIIEAEFPGLAVSVSSSIDPTFREYERTLVTTFDAYLRPKVSSYIRSLERELEREGVPARLEVMQSRGGIASAASAIERPVSLLRSGPAAGVIAARLVGEMCGENNLISNDIGGTTADIGVIADGKPLTSTEGRVLKYPIRIPMIEVSSIGAGGGSIAWRDEAGSLHVGPHSAGAVPGPVCYGAGGTEPTVTDASVVLGYLNVEYFAGGDVALDPAAAHRALEALAAKLGMTKVEAAAGIHTILNNHMADEIRLLTVARGYDPREFALMVLGGAGPLHGGPLARMLGIPRVIVPLAPGVLSAYGLLVSNIEHDHAMSFARPVAAVRPADLEAAFRGLEALGEEDMRRDRVAPGRFTVRRFADMRYLGQSYELGVELSGEIDAGALGRLVGDFHGMHQRVYKQHNREAAVEFVNLRTVHVAPMPRPELTPPAPGRSWRDAQSGVRRVYFREAGGYVQVPVYRRERLPHEVVQPGPFIVEQPDTTTVVFPGESACVERHGNLILEMGPRG